MNRSGTELSGDLARVAQGDRVAFARVYANTSAKLYGVVLRILKRRDLTDEIIQEVYVKVWQRAGDFDATRASPITWLVTIARNRALDEIRRVAHASIEETPEALQVADSGPLAFEMVSAAEDRARLLRCLGGLDPVKADMVKLAYLDGLSREALATKFGHPVATIKTWLHRSLKQLKDCLGS